MLVEEATTEPGDDDVEVPASECPSDDDGRTPTTLSKLLPPLALDPRDRDPGATPTEPGGAAPAEAASESTTELPPANECIMDAAAASESCGAFEFAAALLPKICIPGWPPADFVAGTWRRSPGLHGRCACAPTDAVDDKDEPDARSCLPVERI